MQKTYQVKERNWQRFRSEVRIVLNNNKKNQSNLIINDKVAFCIFPFDEQCCLSYFFINHKVVQSVFHFDNHFSVFFINCKFVYSHSRTTFVCAASLSISSCFFYLMTSFICQTSLSIAKLKIFDFVDNFYM